MLSPWPTGRLTQYKEASCPQWNLDRVYGGKIDLIKLQHEWVFVQHTGRRLRKRTNSKTPQATQQLWGAANRIQVGRTNGRGGR